MQRTICSGPSTACKLADEHFLFRVNAENWPPKFFEKSGVYELICVEGRLLAHKRLGRKVVMAEVVTPSRKEALLQSLVENIARTKPARMDFSRELKRLHDESWDCKRIAEIACKNEDYILSYIRLVEQCEERLIHGVETGVFPIEFAILVATTEDSQIQKILSSDRSEPAGGRPDRPADRLRVIGPTHVCWLRSKVAPSPVTHCTSKVWAICGFHRRPSGYSAGGKPRLRRRV